MLRVSIWIPIHVSPDVPYLVRAHRGFRGEIPSRRRTVTDSGEGD